MFLVILGYSFLAMAYAFFVYFCMREYLDTLSFPAATLVISLVYIVVGAVNTQGIEHPSVGWIGMIWSGFIMILVTIAYSFLMLRRDARSRHR